MAWTLRGLSLFVVAAGMLAACGRARRYAGTATPTTTSETTSTSEAAVTSAEPATSGTAGPTPLAGAPMMATRLAVDPNDSQVCAVLKDGGVACWGGWRRDTDTPQRIPEVTDAVDVSIGTVVIVVTSKGNALVYPVDDLRAKPVELPVRGVSRVAQHLAAACLIRDGGKVTCVHVNDEKQRAPFDIKGLDDAIEIGQGFDVGCALTKRKVVVCWSMFGSSNPWTAPGVANAVSLQVSGEDACVRSSTDMVTCFSTAQRKKTRAELGPGKAVGLYGTFTKSYGAKDVPWACRATDAGIQCDAVSALGDDGAPSGVVGLVEDTRGLNPKQLVLGPAAGCLIDQDDRVRCWGKNRNDFLGQPSGENVKRARTVPVPAARSIVAAFDFSCSLSEGGKVYCWGRTPKKVTELPRAVRLVASNAYACAFTEADEAWCFDETFAAKRATAFDGLTTIIFPQGPEQPFAAIGKNKELLRGSGDVLDSPELVATAPVRTVKHVAISPNGALLIVDDTGKGFRTDLRTQSAFKRAPELDGAIGLNTWGEALMPHAGEPLISIDGYGHCGWTAAKNYSCRGAGEAKFKVKFEGMTAVASGGDFACALDPKGAVWCRGANYKGQCGPGPAFLESKTPVDVLLGAP